MSTRGFKDDYEFDDDDEENSGNTNRYATHSRITTTPNSRPVTSTSRPQAVSPVINTVNVEEDSDEEPFEPSASTIEASTAAKTYIERFYQNFWSSSRDRALRKKDFEQKMTEMGLSDEEKSQRMKTLYRIETQYIRARRVRLSTDTFRPIRIIGRGSFGEVLLVQLKNSQRLYAMKKLKKSTMIARNQVDRIVREKNALAHLNDFYKQNDWVVKLYYSFQDALWLYLVMEYVPGGDLMTQLEKYEVFTEKETQFYIAELVLAVDSIHKFNYIHRDIKPDNILLDKNGHLKISDFGLCTGLNTAEEKANTFRSRYKERSFGRGGEFGSEKSKFTMSSLSVPSMYHTPELERENWGDSEKRDRFSSWNKRRRVLAFSEVGTPDYMAPEVLNPNNSLYQHTSTLPPPSPLSNSLSPSSPSLSPSPSHSLPTSPSSPSLSTSSPSLSLNEDVGYGQEADWWSVGVLLFEMLCGFPVFYSDEDDPTPTFEKILNFPKYLEEALDEVDISGVAIDLIRRFLCEKKNRIGRNGIDEIKSHPFFAGIDWENIRQEKAPFVPILSDPTDTGNFPTFPAVDIEKDKALQEELRMIEERDQEFPKWRGRRLRQTDIPFIGFTYKNLAAVPSLLSTIPGSTAVPPKV